MTALRLVRSVHYTSPKLFVHFSKQVECHIYWPQTELHELCKKLNISFTAYAPLGSPARKKWSPNSKWPEGNPLSDPVAKKLADKHHKTAAQILLRYLIQRGMIVIPKTVHPERAKENMDVFDFTLSDDEMEKLNTLKTRTRLFIWASAFAHPFYPWADVNKSEFDETTKKN
ncbi:oxidoreductase, aldo/keto reductase family protein [Oesophagostomum dentatum]|uniref:Oxidoreductase, aldo/keto reductase family protein n=1 Tax=Oesophagostomum dentatum TaxID=61180 RepID=A0A0B1SDL5_OESDE|nr:oxidoreductase, aldo/keto reductase family protein [Oesophagostomum dentatum]